jgi:hypothetical protein
MQAFPKAAEGFEPSTFCMASRVCLAVFGSNCRSSLTGLVFEMSAIDGGLRTE